ncbi:hypothetical protein ES692_07035 [Psychroserpens burtonensis]|uniref:Uncharacterized protein n=1 Tax=Psychroserpens burtonensis TaxID=49278 RepID=A0A5C7BBD8_9FLAO|nr:hypothetical protein [Psychroserpens burtonensis]TXE18394.1 hypothetical protein ES692_07035 [Psychroserpens burtonensis]
MWSLFRIFLFIIGVALIFLFFSFELYHFIILWFIPVIGLAFMGINPFGPSSEKAKKIENNRIPLTVNQNLNNSIFKHLTNPLDDKDLKHDFIDNTRQTLIFHYQGKKQIVNSYVLENEKLEGFSLIENRNGIFNLEKIQQLKTLKGYKLHYWYRVKFSGNLLTVRKMLNDPNRIEITDSDFIRFRGGYDMCSWKLTESLIYDFDNIGEGKQHDFNYITLSVKDLFLKSSKQEIIKTLRIEKNHIVAFDYDSNEYRIFKIENVDIFEILYS